MTGIEDLLKCPGCGGQGVMEIVIRRKMAHAECQVCSEIVTSRVPYPKHRSDHEGYQYVFRIPSVRPIDPHPEDEQTCSQKEWEEQK
jgi:hypothetical protein